MTAASVLRPQGESQLSPASLGGSPRSAGGFDPGSFQMTTSALGPRVCESLDVSFKRGVSLPQPSGSPKIKPRWYSKPNF